MNMDMDMNLQIENNWKNNKTQLYYYLWFVHYILILFFILGIIIIYNNNSISFSLILVIIFLLTIFIQNITAIHCFYSEPVKEGWRDINCFRLYSQYAMNQYKTDQYDISYNILLNDIRQKINTAYETSQSAYGSLGNGLASLFDNVASNLADVVQTQNAWNSQYATTLQSMNNMNNSLKSIHTNLNATPYIGSITIPTANLGHKAIL